MCMQTNFGGKSDKSYRIRTKKEKSQKSKKPFDFETLSKPDPSFVDERIKK